MRGVWFDVSALYTFLSVLFVTMDGFDRIVWCYVIDRFTGSYCTDLFLRKALYTSHLYEYTLARTTAFP
jgi:hypothetical protein